MGAFVRIGIFGVSNWMENNFGILDINSIY